MNLLCTNCGENFELDTILHTDPNTLINEGFVIKGQHIIEKCPDCASHKRPILDPEVMALVKIASVLLDGDPDGLASELSDFVY